MIHVKNSEWGDSVSPFLTHTCSPQVKKYIELLENIKLLILAIIYKTHKNIQI